MRKNFRKYTILFFTALLLSFCSFQDEQADAGNVNTENNTGGGFTNLYKVSGDLYRSEQPGKAGLVVINGLGIKTIINMRQCQTDRCKFRKTGLVLKHIPVNTWKISYDDVLLVLKTIRDAEKPVLLHCKHGSDRTGCVVAAYRMVYNGYTREDAVMELREKKYGFHEASFQNIIKLLNTVDIERLKADLERD